MPKNKKLIPELRFPEFENEGGWVEKKLGEVAEVITGSTPSTKETKYYGGEFMFVSPADIDDNRYIELTKTTLTELGFSKTRKIKANSVMFVCIGSTIGKVAMNRFECATNQQINSLVSNNDNSSGFLYSNLEHNSTKIAIIAGNQAVPIINKSLFSSVELLFPPTKKEQQKIASCLSSLDEVIAAHRQKLELLKKHKKGLMQNLFPLSESRIVTDEKMTRIKGGAKKKIREIKKSVQISDSDNVPRLRFPEFENEGEWVEKEIGEVYGFKVTNSFSRALLNYEKGEVKNIHYGDIHTKFKTLFDIEKEDVPFINPDVSIENIDKENYCLVGDIVFADASEDVNDIGKSIEITNLNNQQLLAGLHTLLARQKQSELAIGFGGYLFKSDWIKKQIQRESQGAKVLGISKTRISDVLISFPKNQKEQQKIASCLSSLDELIMAEAEKIEQLQEHKKGLMQGLFPKIEN